MPTKHPVRIGTCGWSYDDWKGVFYPKGTASGDYLPFLAQHYPIVEVDSTFYHSPRPSMVQGWYDKTPDSFGFCLKVPQAITHEKLLAKCEREVEVFLAAAKLLREKLACCVLQFGYFNKKMFASPELFTERLDTFLKAWPDEFPVAVEIRNKGWVTPAYLDCLRSHKATFVLTDQAWMPTPAELMAELDVVTGLFAYMRLLGDRKAVDDLTEKVDHIVIDRSKQLADDARVIKQLSKQVPVIVAVNNHFAGYSPETIRMLTEELGT
jgi:uncharacterized protein YecE (DUF72 family)